MSAVAELNPRSLAVTEAGVSVWLDQIPRSMIEGGELARMVSVESLRGVTSSPAIFEKAILGSDDYDEDLRTLAPENLDSVAIYEHSAIRDVQLAADALAGVHRESGDGFVSLEVSPHLAHDTEGTLDQVHSFWRRVDRVNVMITLLFVVSAYDKVAQAFIRALERRHAEGLELSVNSVASFFVSIRSATVAATRFGYGPRFLHSTGQLHKGGPPTGRFLQLVDTPARDAEIPGAGYSFGTLIAAQAAGDLETLRSHGLGAERVELEGDPVAAVRRLTARIKAILEGS
jgi:Transaldolase/Fructose-6-phosphate aldolase